MDQCTITLTRVCNLRCTFCYAQGTKYKCKDELSFADFKKIVDFSERSGIKNIVLTGGEPTLYPHLLEAIRYIKSKSARMVPAITTNGIRLSDGDFCHALVANGLKYVDISLKGATGDECREETGIDCFEQQMKAIRNMTETGIEVTCSIILTKQSIGSFCATVRKACQNGARQISFTFEIDNMKSSKTNEDYLIEHNPFPLIESFMLKTEKLNSMLEDWWIEYSFPFCIYTQDQLTHLSGKLAYPCQIHKNNGITFDTRLNAIPCNMYFDTILGKLGRDFVSLSDYQNGINGLLSKGRKYMEIKRMPSQNCKDCRHFENCLGGCPVVWKNYSYDALMAFKSKFYSEKSSSEMEPCAF